MHGWQSRGTVPEIPLTVSDEGKRRRKGKKGIVVNKKGVHGDAILRQGRLVEAEAWCRHQESLLPCSF